MGLVRFRRFGYWEAESPQRGIRLCLYAVAPVWTATGMARSGDTQPATMIPDFAALSRDPPPALGLRPTVAGSGTR